MSLAIQIKFLVNKFKLIVLYTILQYIILVIISHVMMNLNSKYLHLCMVVLAMYLMLMDLGFYLEVQRLPVRGESNESNISSSAFVYSPFKPITIKQLMLPATVQVIFKDFFGSNVQQDLKKC